MFGFLKSAVRTVGRGVSSGVGALAHGASEVADLTGKVPVIGKGLHAIVDVANSPLYLTASIAKGDRIDKAVIKNIKAQVRAVKDVAPYAQMVISLVPGAGTGVSAIISAGGALASGQPIDAALVAGVRGAIPGGMVGTGVFDAAIAISHGKTLSSVGLAALPIPEGQKKAVAVLATAASDMAAGKRVDSAIARAAEESLPTNIRKAVTVGLALGHGAKVQTLAKKAVGPSILNALSGKGAAIARVNPVTRAGLKAIPGSKAQAGFKVGVTMSRTNATPIELVAIASKLKGAQLAGFNAALAAHIGRVTSKAPATLDGKPAAQFAYAAVIGAKTLSPNARTELLKVLAANTATRPGVEAAITEGSLTSRFKLLLQKILAILKSK
jgi:hypothetical protein